MAEPSLQLRLAQKLALAPQLQQAIKLLQLNRIELREYIQEVLDSNPILEREEGEGTVETPAQESASGEVDNLPEDLSKEWESESFADEQWAQTPSYEGFSGESQIPDSSDDGLLDHLLWQINLSHFNDVDTAIAHAVVYGLDEDGFLAETIEEIRGSLAPELLVSEEEVLAVLHRIQRMEPVGVATRDTSECIRVQLSALP